MKFSYLFPRIFSLHRETQKPMDIPSDSKLWPKSWSIVEYKEYLRFPTVSLPKPEKLTRGISDVIISRHSGRKFGKKPLSLEEISSILFWSFGRKKNYFPTGNEYAGDEDQRVYPSGGARYPLEIYFMHRGGSDLPGGLYHYNVKKHAVEQLLDKKCISEIDSFPNYPFARNATLHIYVTGIPERNMRKYKSRGYRFVLLEVGAVMAHVYLVAESLGLSVCALGVNQDTQIEELLDIDNESEIFLGYFIIGTRE